MKPRIDVITLAVGDLDRSLAFYRDGLGLETTASAHRVRRRGDRRSRRDRDLPPPRRPRARALPAQRARARRPSSDHRRRADQHRTTRREQSRGRCGAGPTAQAGATLTGRPHDRPWGIYSGSSATPPDTSGRSSGPRTHPLHPHRVIPAVDVQRRPGTFLARRPAGSRRQRRRRRHRHGGVAARAPRRSPPSSGSRRSSGRRGCAPGRRRSR